MNAPLYRQPFHPASDFVAAAPFTLNGKDLNWGDPVDTTGVDDRLLRALYEQRKIDYAEIRPVKASGGKATVEATVEGTVQAKVQATLEATLEGGPQAADQKGHADTDKKIAPRYKVKHAGLGGWKVIDDKGVPVGAGHKTKALAEEAAAALNAK